MDIQNQKATRAMDAARNLCGANFRSTGNNKDVYRADYSTEFVGDDVDAVQEIRAQELEQIGLLSYASQVRRCGTIQLYNGIPQRTQCNRRLCPICAERVAQENAQKVLRALKRMKRPQIFIFELRSKCRWDLRETLDDFRTAQKTLRRRKRFMEMVQGGISAIEVPLTRDRRAWNVHSHVVLDVTDEFDPLWVDDQWHGLLGSRAWFVPHRDRYLQPWNAEGFAKYAMKAVTRCPQPSEEPSQASLEHLLQLHQGLQHRNLLLMWGSAWSPEVEED